jgi:hypothetical protein
MIVMILAVFYGFSACDAGAKKLERKPKTHIGKKEKEEKGLVMIYGTPAPSAVFGLFSTDLKKMKVTTFNLGDSINYPSFELGRMIAELSLASEKKDQYSIYRSLQQIQRVFRQLKITDRSLDSLMTQSEKVVLRKADLRQKADELYPKVKELFIISGRKSDLAALKMGIFVHQMDFILTNHKKIAKDKLAELLEFQKATAQNLLSILIDVDDQGQMDHFQTQLERILSVFDKMNFTFQRELIYQDEQGVYVISGGREYSVEGEVITDLQDIVQNFNETPAEDEE